MEYTKWRADTFQNLQMNAGVVASDFTPSTGALTRTNILGATTGGLTFNANPTFEDFGEDIDNVPNNTKQLKRITGYDPVLSGTFVSLSEGLPKQLNGAGSYGEATTGNDTHVIPTHTLQDSDFDDVWFIGDFSDKNANGTGTDTSKAGYIAIHLKNALNTTGFQLKTTKNGKGQIAFEFHGHYDIDDVDDVPFEFYVRKGSAPTTSSTP